MPKEDKTETIETTSAKTTAKALETPLRLVEDLADEAGTKPWELAGLRHATGWAPGKQVTQSLFDAALQKFRKRPQGGGKLARSS